MESRYPVPGDSSLAMAERRTGGYRRKQIGVSSSGAIRAEKISFRAGLHELLEVIGFRIGAGKIFAQHRADLIFLPAMAC